jgi:hypothetical protein
MGMEDHQEGKWTFGKRWWTPKQQRTHKKRWRRISD